MLRLSLVSLCSANSSQTFRDAAGQPCPEAPGLIIPLTSFAQPCLLAQFHEQNPNASPITENIDISAFQLLTYLHAAEEQDAKITQKKGLIERLPPQLKKRRRDSTPPEVLSAARDKRFCDDQARAEARLGALDSSFEGSAGSEEGGSFDNERVVLSQRKLRPRV